MNDIKQEFIQLAIHHGALKFGKFILKSGRKSPYFFNAGVFYHGQSLKKIGELYAKTLIESQIDFQHLFGPAYKGIALTTATLVALAAQGKNATLTFNRKEMKLHGEGGNLIGSPLNKGKTIIIDDVISAGTAFREAKKFIEEVHGHVTAMIISFDRCELGIGSTSTLLEIQNQGIQVLSIINLQDIIRYLQKNQEFAKVEQLLAYQKIYGA